MVLFDLPCSILGWSILEYFVPSAVGTWARCFIDWGCRKNDGLYGLTQDTIAPVSSLRVILSSSVLPPRDVASAKLHTQPEKYSPRPTSTTTGVKHYAALCPHELIAIALAFCESLRFNQLQCQRIQRALGEGRVRVGKRRNFDQDFRRRVGEKRKPDG